MLPDVCPPRTAAHTTQGRVMITPRIVKLGASAGLCGALLLGGCKSASSKGPSAGRPAVSTTQPSNAVSPTAPATDASEPATPGLLAKKSESYSQELAALLER